MAYSDDAVKAKLAALSETQDSIVTVAQWIMFHRYAHVNSIVLRPKIIHTNFIPGVTPTALLPSGSTDCKKAAPPNA